MIEWRDPEHPASADVGGHDVWPELTRTQAPNAAELLRSGTRGSVHMGVRANFVVIRNGHAKAHYDQWAGMGCIYSFAAGPDGACEAISEFEPTNALMHWVSAEGGYLIDFDEKERIKGTSSFSSLVERKRRMCPLSLQSAVGCSP
jgi:hypothetical protein